MAFSVDSLAHTLLSYISRSFDRKQIIRLVLVRVGSVGFLLDTVWPAIAARCSAGQYHSNMHYPSNMKFYAILRKYAKICSIKFNPQYPRCMIRIDNWSPGSYVAANKICNCIGIRSLNITFRSRKISKLLKNFRT